MKILKLLISFSLAFSLVGCSSKEASKEETDKEQVEEKEDTLEKEKEELESIGEVEVENGLLFVKITLPADLVEGITQEKLDEEAGTNYTKATLNEDGSVTYKMTKKQHQEMLKEISSSFDEAVDAMMSEEGSTFTKIEHNKEFSEFNITLSTNEVGLVEAFSVFAFYMYGGMYNIFTGKENTIVVKFYGPDGTLIDTYDSAKMAEAISD